MRRLALVLCVFALPSIGCVKRSVIPDPTVPHQVAKESEVVIWARAPDGKMVRMKVRLLEGWWIAGPPVVEE